MIIVFQLLFVSVYIAILWCWIKAYSNQASEERELITWFTSLWLLRDDMFTPEGNKYRKLCIKLYGGLILFAVLLMGLLSLII